jgi:uncharacterized protein YggE
MKRFLAITSLIFACAAFAADEAPFETVSVTGTGHVMLTPDRYTFTVGVQTIATTVDDAVRENNTRVSAVIAALKRAGAQENEIRTSNFSIWPQQDYQQGQTPRITGYQVTNSITVRRDKIGDAGKLLQAAVSAGVNTSTGLQFEVSDPTRGRDEGLRAAFSDAKAKATVLAIASGRTLGRALMINEGNVPQPPIPRPMAMRAGVAAGVIQSAEVPVESGTQELTFTVSAAFELR